VSRGRPADWEGALTQRDFDQLGRPGAPQVLLEFGRARTAAATARRPVEDLILEAVPGWPAVLASSRRPAPGSYVLGLVRARDGP
jgi:hypothetical protein